MTVSALKGADFSLALKNARAAAAFLKAHHMPAILRGGYHNLNEVEKLSPIISQLAKTHRIYAESMGRDRDNPATWASMLEMGYSIFMGNKLYDFLAMVKERHFQ